MRIVVTGASGFIGRVLCGALVGAGHDVRAIIRHGDAPRGTAGVRVDDLAEGAPIDGAARGADAIVHLAARVHVMRDRGRDAADRYRKVNAYGTEALLRTAHAHGVRRFIFISSVKAVGDASGPVAWTPMTVARPTDAYGASKRAAERAVLASGDGGLTAVVLRLPVVYGPGMRGNMLRLFELVARGIPVPVGAVDNRRSVAYVGNVVDAIQRALQAPASIREPLFVADEPALSTAALVEQIADALARPARTIRISPAVLRLAVWAGGSAPAWTRLAMAGPMLQRLTDSLVVDTSATAVALGGPPRYSTTEGLMATAVWFRGRLSNATP